ncbi:MAG: hypothetical protein IPL83_05645 [Bdellovibrionales bacterium]|nr:hypothetical protein [Bdellovibrionales bacterium]
MNRYLTMAGVISGFILLDIFASPFGSPLSVAQATESAKSRSCAQRLGSIGFNFNQNGILAKNLREIFLVAEYVGSNLLVVKEGSTPIAIIDVGPLPSQTEWSPRAIKIRKPITAIVEPRQIAETSTTEEHWLTPSSQWPEFALYLSRLYHIPIDHPDFKEMKKRIFDDREVRNLVISNSQDGQQSFLQSFLVPTTQTTLGRTMDSDTQAKFRTDRNNNEIHLEANGKERFFSFQWKDRVFLNRLLSLKVNRPNPSGSVYFINMVFETEVVDSADKSTAVDSDFAPDLARDFLNRFPQILSKDMILRPGFIQVDDLSRGQSFEHFARGSQGEPELLNLADLKDYPERAPGAKLIRKADENVFLSLGGRIEPEPLKPFVIPLLESGSTSGVEGLLSEWDARRLYYWAVDLDGRFLIGPGNYLDNLGSQNYLHLLVGQKPALIGGFVTQDSDSHFRVYIDTQIYGFGPSAPGLDKTTWLNELTPLLERLFRRNVSSNFQIEEVAFAAINPRADAPQ